MTRWLGVTAILFASSALIYPSRGLVLDVRGALGIAMACAALLGAQAYCAVRGMARVRDAARWTFWGVLVSALYVLPMYALARRGVAFHDSALRAADATVGIDVGAIVQWVRAHAWAHALSDVTYASLPVGCIAALLVPSLAGSGARTRTLVGALAFASFATLGVFAFFRAIGPWESYANLAPMLDQRGCAEACRALERTGTFVVDVRSPDPLIAFPSWHTLLAMLAAVTLSGTTRLRAPAWIWGGAVALSTVTTGWHYAVDTLAGALLAGASWAASRALSRRLDPC